MLSCMINLKALTITNVNIGNTILRQPSALQVHHPISCTLTACQCESTGVSAIMTINNTRGQAGAFKHNKSI